MVISYGMSTRHSLGSTVVSDLRTEARAHESSCCNTEWRRVHQHAPRGDPATRSDRAPRTLLCRRRWGHFRDHARRLMRHRVWWLPAVRVVRMACVDESLNGASRSRRARGGGLTRLEGRNCWVPALQAGNWRVLSGLPLCRRHLDLATRGVSGVLAACGDRRLALDRLRGADPEACRDLGGVAVPIAVGVGMERLVLGE